MTIESATYLADLNAAYPDGGDSKAEGDNHIRLIKTVLKNTFPNVNGAVTATDEQLNTVPNLAPKASPSFTGGATIAGGVTVSSGDISLTNGSLQVNDSGSGHYILLNKDGNIELYRAGGGYIDFKNASGDDYDVRIIQNGASGLQIASATTGAVTLTNMKIDVSSPPNGEYAIRGQSSTAGLGGVIGWSQDAAKYGILGHANTYALYGNGQIWINERITTTADLLVEAGTIYLNSAGTRFLNWNSGGGYYQLPNNPTLVLSAGASHNGFCVPTALSGGDLHINNLRWVSAPGYLEVVAGGSAVGFTADISDIREKENIQPSTVNALKTVEELPFFSFDWKEGSIGGEGHEDLGGVAQAWEEIEPSLVFTQQDGLKQLNKGKMAIYALKAIAELSAEVKELRRLLESKA